MLDSFRDRTPRPHLTATLVIWASLELSDTEKIVWYHTWTLDSTPMDACYISSRSMGQRTGRSAKTIEDARSTLCELGLLDSFPRANSNQPGWFAKMYLSTTPQSKDLKLATVEVAGTPDEKFQDGLRFKFDARVKSERVKIRERAESHTDIGRKSLPRGDGGKFRKRAEEYSGMARSARGGEGVGGGVSRLSSEAIERSLPPAVTEHLRQMGDGSHEPENRDERPLTPDQRRAMAEADKREADAITERGFQNIAEIMRKRDEELSRQRAERLRPPPREETGT